MGVISNTNSFRIDIVCFDCGLICGHRTSMFWQVITPEQVAAIIYLIQGVLI